MAGRNPNEIVIGTRGSRLAMAQARWVAAKLRNRHPDLTIRIEPVTTAGDRAGAASPAFDTAPAQPAPCQPLTDEVSLKGQGLAELGRKGRFTRELENALLAGRLDLAVHSAKDLPLETPDGLDLLCVPSRADPRDALISRGGESLDDLPHGAVIGTSSLRRRAQLLLLRPDLQFSPLRGNVDTRIEKVKRGECDAAVLALAGLVRIGMTDQVTAPFGIADIVPAPGQGTLAVQGRADDNRLREKLAAIHDDDAALAFFCEREIVRRLQGGCATPIGVLAEVVSDSISITARVTAPNAARSIQAKALGPRSACGEVIKKVIRDLAARGAAEIIRACRAP